MGKVTRIVASKDLNISKYDELSRQAEMLGALRAEIWQRFGSINGSGIDFRTLRNDWVKNRDFNPLPAKAWKETLRDVLDDIAMYDEASKLKIRQDIAKRTSDKAERSNFYKALKDTEWKNDPYLCRKMRQHKKHGRTKVKNQIILESGVYRQFKGKDGNTWLKIPSFARGRMVCIPLNSNIFLKGCLRLILKDGEVFVHYTIEQKMFDPCGDQIIGVDKGYSEAFADSEGDFHGTNLGEVLSAGTEMRNQRGIARNKLHQLAKKKTHKAKNIYKYNLGKKKLKKQYDHQK
ncbi:MAG: transposase, partial [Proteobacteria bacterium]|nr:transposase [Pseudomonadota bacterium]